MSIGAGVNLINNIMNFTEALEALNSAKKKKTDAEKHLLITKSRLQKARQEAPQLHEVLTDRMAELQADEGSEDAVNDARNEYEEACDRLDDLKTELQAAEKSIPLLNSKLQKAKQQFNEPAYKYYKEQAKPLINKLLKALDEFEATYQDMENLKTEIRNNGLTESNFLPSPIKSVNFSHLKYPVPIERYRQELQDLKQ